MLRISFADARGSARTAAIFIDRDGVINCRRPNDYVLEPSQFVFTPGIQAALKQLSGTGLPIIVISNQAAVGKGLLSAEILREITLKMQREISREGNLLAAVYYCPHRPDQNCECRKPKPELLFRAADDFGIDLSSSVFIGDSETDLEAALAAGCKPVLFASGLCSNPGKMESRTEVPVARSAEELFDVVMKCLGPK